MHSYRFGALDLYRADFRTSIDPGPWVCTGLMLLVAVRGDANPSNHAWPWRGLPIWTKPPLYVLRRTELVCNQVANTSNADGSFSPSTHACNELAWAQEETHQIWIDTSADPTPDHQDASPSESLEDAPLRGTEHALQDGDAAALVAVANLLLRLPSPSSSALRRRTADPSALAGHRREFRPRTSSRTRAGIEKHVTTILNDRSTG